MKSDNTHKHAVDAAGRPFGRFWQTASLVALTAACFGGASAQAQTAQAPAPTASVGDIIVTAQRRAQSAQHVPISVQALSADTLTAAGVSNTDELTGKIPGLSITFSGAHIYFLRGVGTTGSSNNIEQSVGAYLDGVYLYSTWSAAVPASGVQRVEVLKGPQGTLFGRNTTGGVIQTITRDPMAAPTLEASLGYGNYDTTTATLFASTKLGDDVGVSVAVDVRNQDEGYGHNSVLNVDQFEDNNRSVQLKGVWQPNDGTKFTAFLWYSRMTGTGINIRAYPGTAGTDGIVRHLGFYETVAGDPERQENENKLVYFRWDQDVGFANFVSLSSYRTVDQYVQLDQDGTPFRTNLADENIPIHNYSQEFQLLSKGDGPLTWTLGAYWFSGVAKYDPIVLHLSPTITTGRIIFRRQDTDSIALYGQGTYAITPDTRLTLGYRYTDEDINNLPGASYQNGLSTDINSTEVPPSATLLAAIPNDELHYNFGNGRIGIDHDINDHVMVYASFSRGTKSGGFPQVVFSRTPAYRPERLDATEIGIKSNLFDRTLRLNAAIYHYEFTNIQVNAIVAGNNLTYNAAGAEINGFDADFDWRATDQLKVYGSVGYAHGEYTDFAHAVVYQLNGAGASAINTAPGGGENEAGKTTVFTPEWSGSLGATYRIPTSMGEFVLDAYANYQGSRFASPGNRLELPDYTTANASVGWSTPDNHYGVRVWANNLFDEQYLINGQESSIGYSVVPGTPQTFGVTLSARY